MSNAPVAKPRTQIDLEVLRSEWPSEHMVRVILGGAGFGAFQSKGFSDQYVKLHFLQPGLDYAEPVDVFALRETLPREQWPVTRTYTVRWVNEQNRELAIDFVVHGDIGLAGPWAAAAQPGDRLIVSGPGGAYNPNPEADWYLFAGDESALPAISAAIEALPTQATGLAFIEVPGESDIQELSAPEGLIINWLPRGTEAAGDSTLLIDAVAGASWPEGTVDAFVHGEREYMKALRDVLFKQRGLTKNQVSLSGYWARGRTEDRFQAEKRQDIGKIL
ncbi:NADPH-dependent ferric siderophore reductase [Psychromicrobium silvestre]|uniref:NADPH-dependent ferric siderophore reductase n=1 Tax=Psychromicrobium silvestre TaxID=1645614 RepID=A0A7Y9LVE2_9MICC|nr:siderophore-interacting protein [Psychromicrobium silvestre]NYE96328.1 NADPH-dependent ferric siderophore reductase [Psychromicrobium silvestre]